MSEEEDKPWTPMSLEEAREIVRLRDERRIAKYGTRTPEEERKEKERIQALRNRIRRRAHAAHSHNNVYRG